MTFDEWLEQLEEKVKDREIPITNGMTVLTEPDGRDCWQAATAAERERWSRECEKRARRYRSMDRREHNPMAIQCANVLEALMEDMQQ